MRPEATNEFSGGALPSRAEMGAVLVVVANNIPIGSRSDGFVDWDDVVQQVTAAAFDHRSATPFWPSAFERGPHSSHPQGPPRCRNLDPYLPSGQR